MEREWRNRRTAAIISTTRQAIWKNNPSGPSSPNVWRYSSITVHSTIYLEPDTKKGVDFHFPHIRKKRHMIYGVTLIHIHSKPFLTKTLGKLRNVGYQVEELRPPLMKKITIIG